ncbi:MAG: hypothetical protein IT368_16820 [Candidatus Hydrogenedentes bacterium]|nr:hypothetical protein [Candidatus Hydrogenedentota bacterium]
MAGHRLFGERDLEDNGAVANAERSALLATDEFEEPDDAGGGGTAMEVNDTVHAVDPTQRLLTALGRFQRQVVKAEKGLPQAEWCDECMNQLITGIEIAYEQDWPDVQQALTDTARVLHSYECARQAERCVSFLQDSYEILCLMVGDLIVDNVRSGVMQKWQERYRYAVQELSDAGIELVEDEDEADTEASPPAAAVAAPAPLTPPAASAPASGEPAADPFGEEAFVPAVEREDAFFLSPPPPLHATEEAQASTDAWLEAAPDYDADEAFVETEAPADGDTSQLPPLEALIEPVAPEGPEAAAADETDDMPADGGFAVQEFETVEEDAAFEEVEEVEEIEEVIMDAPAAVPAAEAAPAPAEEGTPEAMLQTIRRAFAAGNVADAKVFAMQVAADMAQLETDRAESHRGLKQRLLEENAQAISAGEEQVRAAEMGVAEAEARVQDREQDQGAKRLEIEALRTQSAEHEAEIGNLDEQIRQLQAQREAEEQRLRQVQEELERALAEDSRLQTDIESLQDAWERAQDALSTAQALVNRLRQERSEEESALAEAEQVLAGHQRSVLEIRRAIAAITGKPLDETPASTVPAQPEVEGEAADEAADESADDGQFSLLDHLAQEEAHARGGDGASSN